MNTSQTRSENSRPPGGLVQQTVNFFFAAPRAKAVGLAGDFNQWQPAPLQRLPDGWWHGEARLDAGAHEYRFLVDGRPELDPHAPGLARNQHNELVSVLMVI